jgi:hypothetical protein
MTNAPGMMGRDESMPNRASDPDLSSEARDEVRAIAESMLRYGGAANPNATAKLARAVMRYVPAGVPAPAPHPVAAADDKTRPAVIHGVASYSGSPAIDFPPVLTGPGLPAPGVICEPIDDASSGVCEASDDSSTSQNKLNLTGFFDVPDATRR